jgi:hypothetical protein
MKLSPAEVVDRSEDITNVEGDTKPRPDMDQSTWKKPNYACFMLNHFISLKLAL